MRANFLILFSILSVFPSMGQSPLPNYYARNDFLLSSPGALKTGLYGYDNPALLAYQHQPDLFFSWSDATGSWDDFNRWGLFAAAPNVGFSVIHEKLGSASISDYRISLAGGNYSYGFGFAYGWSSGNRTTFPRSNLYSVGALVRPFPYLSLGTTATATTRKNANEIAVDLAVRPLGNELLTLFADYVVQNSKAFSMPTWSLGGVVEPIAGVRVSGRFFETRGFTFGVQVSFGNTGLSTQAHYDNKQRYSYNSYGVRVGAYDRNVFRKTTQHSSKYIEVGLGPVGYQRFILFDQSQTLRNLLEAIDAAKSDPVVSGIAINTTTMRVNGELLWELREKLKDFKSTGKHVVMFVDHINFFEYHFASVADKIIMDPYGSLDMKGVVLGRAYLKGLFDKVGIGVDELRFFKYKSAAESFSRTSMSEADREQRQRLVDGYYEVARADVAQGRNLTYQRFDELVNTDAIMLADEALAKGLVDTLGRWDDMKDVIKSLEGSEKGMMGRGAIERFNLPPDNSWGEKPQIAVIYAIGVCAMDEGITARKLVKDVQAAAENSKIKAIVLRVDSPGGDPMASDYIALALKKAKEKKPVIVSQGAVAASGGYWLSMYADTIVAAPTTITGSIGVIGAWLYNKGLKDSLGLATDLVKVGAHADLGFGFPFPLIGVLPDNPLSTHQRSRIEIAIRSLYKDFVGKVALGRNKQFDEIESIAQGRVWTGVDGKKNGLVDELGGLETAIRIAQDRAGLRDREVTIVEYPSPKLFDSSILMPRLLGIEAPAKDDRTMDLIKFHLKNNGKPMPMLPLEDLLMFDTELELK